MANSNFIIQNGLQIGPTTIFAGNGDIITSGNVNSGGSTGLAIPNQLTSTSFTSNTGILSVGGNINYGPDYGLVASFVSNIPAYTYVAVQNLSSNANASASFTAYNNTGLSYIDVGVNSSNFSASSSGFINNSLNTANASYAYSYGGELVVGTWNNNGIHFITNAAGTVGDSMFIAGNGNVYISGNLSVSGNTSIVNTVTTIATETANSVQVSYMSGNSSINGGAITAMSTTPIIFANTNASTSTTTGAFTVAGGVGIAGAVYVGGNGTNSLVATGHIIPSSNVSYNLGSTTAWFNNIYGTSTHALYADLAENYVGDKVYPAGTVLMFGGSAEVTVADADTTAVAGIVSTNPAHLMNGGLQGHTVVPLALMGRVPCQVIGPVAKGDLLVSAGWGYAKTNNNPAVGSVIGKALEDFATQSKGTIEVVVGRV
jgi:hypothetical protein